ncbi:MAG: hypothetical protein IM556_14660 [Pseudanabaena sp. M110S1SP2A07QC]|nr:hypothetical protein [Pseudanabaena sp. M110S1SP2A07QC]
MVFTYLEYLLSVLETALLWERGTGWCGQSSFHVTSVNNQIQQLPKSEINKVPEYLQQIPQGTVLLYPLILDDRLEIFLFSPNSLPISRTVRISREKLEKLIADFRSGLRDTSSKDVKEPAEELYNLLIKPIDTELVKAKTKTILYAPDGQLRYVPTFCHL